MRMKNSGGRVGNGDFWCGLGGAKMLLLLVVLGILTELEVVSGQEKLNEGDASACLYDSDCKGELCCLYHYPTYDRESDSPDVDDHFHFTTCGTCSKEKGRKKGSKEKPKGPAKFCRRDKDCQNPLCCIASTVSAKAQDIKQLGMCKGCN